MLKIGSIRWKGRCVKHPRYSPEEEGEPGLKGGCPRCTQLLDIYQSHKRTLTLLKAFGPSREMKPRSKPAKAAIEDRQTSLFQF